MSATTAVTVRAEGDIVVPSELRSRYGWSAGTVLVTTETEDGLLLRSRAALLGRIQAHVAEAPLIEQLIVERRREAAAEDATL